MMITYFNPNQRILLILTYLDQPLKPMQPSTSLSSERLALAVKLAKIDIKKLKNMLQTKNADTELGMVHLLFILNYMICSHHDIIMLIDCAPYYLV